MMDLGVCILHMQLVYGIEEIAFGNKKRAIVKEDVVTRGASDQDGLITNGLITDHTKVGWKMVLQMRTTQSSLGVHAITATVTCNKASDLCFSLELKQQSVMGIWKELLLLQSVCVQKS